MSWESTVTYYQLINEAVKAKLGRLHSAKILLYSVDFVQIEQYQASYAWKKVQRHWPMPQSVWNRQGRILS